MILFPSLLLFTNTWSYIPIVSNKQPLIDYRYCVDIIPAPGERVGGGRGAGAQQAGQGLHVAAQFSAAAAAELYGHAVTTAGAETWPVVVVVAANVVVIVYVVAAEAKAIVAGPCAGSGGGWSAAVVVVAEAEAVVAWSRGGGLAVAVAVAAPEVDLGQGQRAQQQQHCGHSGHFGHFGHCFGHLCGHHVDRGSVSQCLAPVFTAELSEEVVAQLSGKPWCRSQCIYPQSTEHRQQTSDTDRLVALVPTLLPVYPLPTLVTSLAFTIHHHALLLLPLSNFTYIRHLHIFISYKTKTVRKFTATETILFPLVRGIPVCWVVGATLR